MTRRIELLVLSAVAILVSLTGYSVGKDWYTARLRNSSSANVPRKDALPRPGRQLIFVYVGSSRCNPSNQKDVIASVASSVDLARRQAVSQNLGFVTIGIAREQSAGAGIAHLAGVYGFDEVAAGQGALNQAAFRFVSHDHPGIAATPQVLVIERVLAPLGTTVDDVEITERVLLRKVGAVEISQWTARGAKIPLMQVISNPGRRL